MINRFQPLAWGCAGLLLSVCLACTPRLDAVTAAAGPPARLVNAKAEKPWSERMARSVIKRAPEAWRNDFQTRPRWNYTLGLLLNAVGQVGENTGDEIFTAYVQSYGDTMIHADGTIRDYDIAAFNIDHIAPGPLLFRLLDQTGEKRYEMAIQTLRRQLEWQPQTTDGGYWHKLRYPWQMWLDGLYMGEPFQAEYAKRYDQPELFEHIAQQFILAEKHTRDPETGLLYHGYDESRIQRWSDPETGLSQHFWARAIGWYAMGLVDVLDHFPADHPQRPELIAILNRTLEAVVAVQDPETGVWWQVIDRAHQEGNYLEATSSCMFAYALLKGINEGYLDQSIYLPVARKTYQGILDTFIQVDEDDGEVHLLRCCAVAGLGGNPYRDGSYAYYIGEPIRANDPKGMGPFITASLELEKLEERMRR